VRELERVIERAVALADGDQIELEDLPPPLTGDYRQVIAPSLAADETMRAWGSRYARLVLQRCGYNKRRACRALGISYHTLRAYLRYGANGSGAVPEWPEEMSGSGDAAAAPAPDGQE
jgi:DNA-binding NtrC family response regulator